MESLQILLNQMGESKVILTYTKLPEQILATYYRDKHISAIGINKSAMITKRFEFEVFKAAVGLHKTLSGTDYNITIDDDNIDMLAPVGEAVMIDHGIIIGNRIVLNRSKSTDYSDMVYYRVNSLESDIGKELPLYELMPKAEYELRRNIKIRNILMAGSPSAFNAIKYYANQCKRLS